MDINVLWISLQLSILPWTFIWIFLDFYGYPCIDLLWIFHLFGYPCISMDIDALTCYGFSIQGAGLANVTLWLKLAQIGLKVTSVKSCAYLDLMSLHSPTKGTTCP